MSDPVHEPDPVPDVEAPVQPADLAENALVEEVSIDGMCGVY